MVDLTPHKAGIDAALNARAQVCNDPRGAFMNVLSMAGFTPPSVLQIGKLDRIDGAEDKRGKKSGWYCYNEIEDSQNEGQIDDKIIECENQYGGQHIYFAEKTLRQMIERIEAEKKTVADCEEANSPSKGDYWQAYRHGDNDAINNVLEIIKDCIGGKG